MLDAKGCQKWRQCEPTGDQSPMDSPCKELGSGESTLPPPLDKTQGRVQE
jgi:hypothetical protein